MAGELSDDTAQDDALSDARAMGLGEEEIADLREALSEQHGFRLWAAHLEAVRALVAAGTQWRSRLVLTTRGPVERVVGLDYAGVRVALDMCGLTLTREQWGQLGVLERAAADAMNGLPMPGGIA